MIKIGTVNRLQFVHQNRYVAVFRSDEEEEVTMYEPPSTFSATAGDLVDVFVFWNSDEHLEATLHRPVAMVGEFAYLRVVDVQNVGAFLDWGLKKDLFVPHREQMAPMEMGQWVVVRIYEDKSGRISASSKINKFLNNPLKYKVGEEVDLLIWDSTDLGIKAVVNNQNVGLLFRNEIFQPLEAGQRLKGFVKQIQNGKLTLSLTRSTATESALLAARILSHLEKNNGESALTDKSPPKHIYAAFGVSKSQYKNALGQLYRERKIVIEKDKIVLAKEN